MQHMHIAEAEATVPPKEGTLTTIIMLDIVSYTIEMLIVEHIILLCDYTFHVDHALAVHDILSM